MVVGDGSQPTLSWVMRPEAVDGARDGGDLAGEVFKTSIASLVREILQNTKDAWTGPPATEVRFRLVQLAGERLKTFQDAMGWNALEPHLLAASGKNKRIREVVESIQTKGLRVLVIEDSNTSGLRGPEDGAGDSPHQEFASLTKDRLFTGKEGQSGGSYGLGKAVLWAFSAFRTVLFNSTIAPAHLLPGQASPRLFGRVHLPWHRANASNWDGPGWFGTTNPRIANRAESVMGGAAEEQSHALLVPRSPEASGTSIVIVGFDEPLQDERPLRAIAADIGTAVEQWFWPSLGQMGQRGIRVWVEYEEPGRAPVSKAITPEACVTYAHFIRMYEAYREGATVDVLVEPGQVACRRIEVGVPARRDGKHSAFAGHADLLVCVSEPGQALASANTVALFRKPGMVIDYWIKPDRKLGLGKRGYYAALVCGDAVARGTPGERGHFDEFLRCAENPAHDAWERWDRLRDLYQQPYRGPLDVTLLDDVVRHLKELVVAAPPPGEDAPRRLVEKFRIGKTGVEPHASLKVTQSEGRLGDDGRWVVGAKLVYVGAEAKSGWRAKVDLRFAEDGGAHGDGKLIEEAEIVDSKGVSAVVEDGVLVVDVGASRNGIREVKFKVYSTRPSDGVVGLADAESVELRAALEAV
jgi:hypothetical protein